ncbi:hypothetical protein Ahy_A02g009705 [Arachis hypogaea]|uniref:Leucine-rich repeat-containing N-terminal plant-type domain-containing protein n=1 Tax=Arachis hypogaea TaxID=3818 RepID=A0A445EHT7_ARAHY|nr:hypothetical protein Ahy_A02g009705 [Arachis hypogaea]
MGLLTFFLFWQRVLSTNNNNNNEIVGDEAAYLIKLREAISPAPSSWFNVTNMCDWSHVICGTDLHNNPCVEEINLNSMSLKSLEQLSLSLNTNLAPWTFPASLNNSIGLTFLSLDATNLLDSLSLKKQPDWRVAQVYWKTTQARIVASRCLLSDLKELLRRSHSQPVKLHLFAISNAWGQSINGSTFSHQSPLLDSSFAGQQLDTGPVPSHRFATAAFGYPLLLARTWRVNNPCNGWNFITCDIQHKIRTVNLTNLNLTGTISPAFANLTDLEELYLVENNLNGSIPESLTTLPQLKILDVSNNNLSGIIPIFSPNMVLINTANNAFIVAHSPARTTPLWIKLGASAVSIVGVILIFGVIAFHRKRCFRLLWFLESQAIYTYKEVKKMINSFYEKLGEGGLGIVYKANLDQGNIPTRRLSYKAEENDIVMKMTLVSLWCIQPNPVDRPSIDKVIDILKGPLESVPYPPKPVLFSSARLIPQYSNMSYSNEYSNDNRGDCLKRQM